QVDLVHHAKDQCKADPDKCIGRTEEQSVNDGLREIDQIQ
ncbi:MAG: hypothetical protein RL001_621, partial [Pseudomonadota bacterium]